MIHYRQDPVTDPNGIELVLIQGTDPGTFLQGLLVVGRWYSKIGTDTVYRELLVVGTDPGTYLQVLLEMLVVGTVRLVQALAVPRIGIRNDMQ